MVRFVGFLLILGVCFFASGGKDAYAARFSGEYFIKVCSVDSAGNELIKGGKIACQAYISGVIDFQNMTKSMDVSTGLDFCIPADVTLNEIQIRVLAYFYEHNKLHRKFLAAPGVALALSSAYPCGKKRK